MNKFTGLTAKKTLFSQVEEKKDFLKWVNLWFKAGIWAKIQLSNNFSAVW